MGRPGPAGEREGQGGLEGTVLLRGGNFSFLQATIIVTARGAAVMLRGSRFKIQARDLKMEANLFCCWIEWTFLLVFQRIPSPCNHSVENRAIIESNGPASGLCSWSMMDGNGWGVPIYLLRKRARVPTIGGSPERSKTEVIKRRVNETAA